jgi:dGTPase
MMMEWQTLLNLNRLGKGGTNATLRFASTARSAFESDVDRVAFSTAFRRLARKTQVFPLADNDHVHTRLTHSLEVSKVGRTLGTAVGRMTMSGRSPTAKYPDGIDYRDFGNVVEAASLAHDIGHPPFGHAGERALRHWFNDSEIAKRIKDRVTPAEWSDLSRFDGNAQGFRRLTQLEKHLFRGGLNLTYATLGAYVKYPYPHAAVAGKAGVFVSEMHLMNEVVERTGLIRNDGTVCRHPLSLLVEAADDICYGILDLEDAVEMGVLPLQDVCDELLVALSPDDRSSYRPSGNEQAHRVVFARMRGKIFEAAIVSVVNEFSENYEAIMSGEFNRDLLNLAAQKGDPAASAVLNAKERAVQDVFNFQRKVLIELASYEVLARLMDDFSTAALEFASAYASNPDKPAITAKADSILGLFGDHKPRKDNVPPNEDWTTYQCLRRAIDFVSGMTDRFAIHLSNQLSGNIHP